MGIAFSGFSISVKGKNKALNQDYCLVREFKNAFLMVVCDGLGSKKFSHIGSRYLAKSLITILRRESFDCNDLVKNEAKLLKLWQKHINKQGFSTKECSTTLLCAIIGEKYAYFGRVGDGVMVIFADEIYVLEDNDEFSNITTPFGTQAMKWLKLDTHTLRAAGLCSDGISEIIASQHTKAFFNEYINTYKNINSQSRKTEIKTWLDEFNQKGFCDDKSIAVAWRIK